MKRTLFTLALLTAGLFSRSYAQDTTQQTNLSRLLTQYYSVQEALVVSDATAASRAAEQLVKTLNGIDYKVISEGNINSLLKDVTALSGAKDIGRQRERFANLSKNMAMLAKSVKLTTTPVYQVYCPMKKAWWLSSEKAVRNPYYGSSMLTCGEVTDSITHQ